MIITNKFCERKDKILKLNEKIAKLESDKYDYLREAIKENKIEYISYPPFGMSNPKKAILDTNDLMFLVIGTWDCPKSPIGLCFYHDIEDECHDNCLICGNPDERK